LEVEKEKFSLTFDGYVTKPVKARELKEKIAALTNQSKVGSS
jgi:DNA-binding response OmpR family regulator